MSRRNMSSDVIVRNRPCHWYNIEKRYTQKEYLSYGGFPPTKWLNMEMSGIHILILFKKKENLWMEF
jgi:hypothetical protein